MERIVVVVLVSVAAMVSFRHLGSAVERNIGEVSQASVVVANVSTVPQLGSSVQAMGTRVLTGAHKLAVVADLADLRRITGLAQEAPTTLREALPTVRAKIAELENVRLKQLEPYRDLLTAARKFGDVAESLANPSAQELLRLSDRLAIEGFGFSREVQSDLLKFAYRSKDEIDQFIDGPLQVPTEYGRLVTDSNPNITYNGGPAVRNGATESQRLVPHIFYDNRIGHGKDVLERIRDYRFKLGEFENYLSDAKPFEYVERPRLFDINTASADELALLPGIDQLLADRIIKARAAKPIETIDDLKAIPALGTKRTQRIATFFDELGELERALDVGTIRAARRHLADAKVAFYGYGNKFDMDADHGLDGLRTRIEDTIKDADRISQGSVVLSGSYMTSGRNMKDFVDQFIRANEGPYKMDRIVGTPDKIAAPTKYAMIDLMINAFGQRGSNTLPLEKFLAERLQSQVFGKSPPKDVSSSARPEIPREFGSDYWQARGVNF